MAVVWILLALLGGLALIKAAYVLTMILALPASGGALFCTTHRAKIAAILDAFPMQAGQTVVDLGCGDGRFLAAAARRYGVKGIGYEINLLAYLMARIRQIRLRGHIRIERRNFWHVPLGEVDLVFCYLFPDLLERLALKARAELRDGAILVSANFPLPGWSPEQILTAARPAPQDPIYVYRKGC